MEIVAFPCLTFPCKLKYLTLPPGAIAQIARAAGAKLSLDSTFATPVATGPLSLGADFVVYSLSKYLCGHGDAIGGADNSSFPVGASRILTTKSALTI
jgi:O-acetylhomoserine/O-acetylserine sulfhydrylase-like pyridoxal-dependent enzyme